MALVAGHGIEGRALQPRHVLGVYPFVPVAVAIDDQGARRTRRRFDPPPHVQVLVGECGLQHLGVGPVIHVLVEVGLHIGGAAHRDDVAAQFEGVAHRSVPSARAAEADDLPGPQPVQRPPQRRYGGLQVVAQRGNALEIAEAVEVPEVDQACAEARQPAVDQRQVHAHPVAGAAEQQERRLRARAGHDLHILEQVIVEVRHARFRRRRPLDQIAEIGGPFEPGLGLFQRLQGLARRGQLAALHQPVGGIDPQVRLVGLELRDAPLQESVGDGVGAALEPDWARRLGGEDIGQKRSPPHAMEPGFGDDFRFTGKRRSGLASDGERP